jgi:hypothetical protein
LFFASEVKFAFRLENPQKSVTLVTRNRDDKANWLQHLRNAIELAKSYRSELISGSFIAA